MGKSERMGLAARARRELRFLSGVLRTLRRLKGVTPEGDWLLCDDLEAAVDRHPSRPAIVFEGRSLSYAQLDALANRFAHWATGRGIKKGETVALFMPNRPEYIAVWYGLSKVGVATALINSNLQGPALCHSLKISGAAHIIADKDTAPAFETVRTQIGRKITEWIVGGAAATADRDLDRALKGVSSLRPTRETARYGLTAKDVALYIYTSGTTGLPKAAKVSSMKAQTYMRGFSAATRAGPQDRIYCALPLYHATGGLCAVGAALLSGGALVLRKRFSASQFWSDLSEQKCTMFVYIGELCRYIVNQPEQPMEHTPIRLAFGNGLRPDVWERLQSRFRIETVLEFYGSTEGNVSLFNFDGRPGAVGRVPKYLRKRFNVRLVRFNVETDEPERSAQGYCIECRPGETGEALGEIIADARSAFSGYADKAATERKILRNAFSKGDAYFRTGDLLRQDEDGYFYFVDRIGDTFRWKGENVSTSEVAERLMDIAGVKEATVYGVAVPGTDGRAGMAALVTDPEFDLAQFGARCETLLPAYAQPVFLRLQDHLETTGTFKYRKADLVADGYSRRSIPDPIYLRRQGSGYQALDEETEAAIDAGEIRL